MSINKISTFLFPQHDYTAKPYFDDKYSNLLEMRFVSRLSVQLCHLCKF